MARSGRGKSIILAREALEAAKHGANVLVWLLEMPTFEFYSRVFSMISSEYLGKSMKIDGIDYNVGFPQREIVMAKMSPEYRIFFQFRQINETWQYY